MAIYAIGDIQGCFLSLLKLLENIDFNRDKDKLLFSGDLVNRGPKSLETLRFIKSLGDCAVSVLGNHDLHLLATYYTGKKLNNKDTIDDILNANDRLELLNWLRFNPLIHSEDGWIIVHAGIPPQWNIKSAKNYALEIENIIQSDTNQETFIQFFNHMYGNSPQQWTEELSGWERWKFIVNALTRMRYCKINGAIDLKNKGKPGTQANNLIPWFRHPNRLNTSEKILFGHWSSLGFINENNVIGLDTGCVWGGRLTAINLDTMNPVWVECIDL